MRKLILSSLLLSAMLLAGSITLASCGSKANENQEQSDETDLPVSEDEDKMAAVYACPMHPEITGKLGDTCSKCHMALEEVTDDTDSTDMHDGHH